MLFRHGQIYPIQNWPRLHIHTGLLHWEDWKIQPTLWLWKSPQSNKLEKKSPKFLIFLG